MADFYPVLSRAIARLTQQTPEARRAIYDRAAQVLIAQLRSVVPPMSEADISRQRMQLDDVIARIEREQQPLQDIEPETFPETLPGMAPDIVPGAVSGTAGEAVRDQPEPEPESTTHAVGAGGTAEAEAIPSDKMKAGDLAAQAGPAAIKPEAIPVSARPVMKPPGEQTAYIRVGVGRPGFDTAEGVAQPDAITQPDRPRLDISAVAPKRSGGMRKAIVASGVLLGVAAIAAMAYYVNRDNLSQQPAVQAQPSRPTPPPDGAKITARAGADSPQVPAPIQPQAGPVPGGAGQRPDIAIAQRAVLYVEPTDPSQPPRAIVGRVTWRVEAQNAGQGQQLETVIRADIEIAESGLNLVFTIRRNTDAAFPASHILGMRFQRVTDDGNGAVKEAGVPQFKTEENERGAPLSAITSILGENLFVSALSRVPIEVERNVELMRTRNWVDIPVRFASGKRGIIAFEKGLSGDQRIAEGFRSWQ